MIDTGLTSHSTEIARKASVLLKERARDGNDGETKIVRLGDETKVQEVERQLRHLAQSYRKLEARIAKAEEIPHLTKADIASIRDAAESRAEDVSRNIMEREIAPLIDELRKNLKFVREFEQAKPGAAGPVSHELSDLVQKLVPFVKSLEKGLTANEDGIDRAQAMQQSVMEYLKTVEDRFQKLDNRMLEIVAAEIQDRRALMLEAAGQG